MRRSFATAVSVTLPAVVMVVALLGDVASAEPVACQRAIAKAASTYAQKRTQAFAKCAEKKLRGQLAPNQECAMEPKTNAAMFQAETKLRTTIANGCAGANKICEATDSGADADDALATIGWDIGQCPGFESSGCTNAIANCTDIATCLVCVQSAAVDQSIDLTFEDVAIAAGGSALNKCQVALGKETAKLLMATSKALGKCEGAVVNGSAPGPCPVPGDGKADPAIAKARAQAERAVCKACGGADKACGGGDDASPIDIGFPSSCPAVTVPGGSSCAGAIASIDDVVGCAHCVVDFKTRCLDALSVPGLKAYPNVCGLQPTPTPTPTVTATPTLSATPTVTATPPPSSSSLKCRRVVAKESQRFAISTIKALQTCEERKVLGVLSPGTDCAGEGTTAARIAKADTKLRGQIAKACGGRNKICNALDSGANADEPLFAIEWQIGSCPDLRGLGCINPLVDCADVGECVSCVDKAAASQSIALYYGSLVPAAPGSDAQACQLAIGKAATAFVKSKLGALAKCEDAVLRGKASAPCPIPGDGKAAAAIAKAEAKMMVAICQTCGGGDRTCGGGDDVAVAELGFPAMCPSVAVPGGAACAGPIADLADVVACVGCLSEANVDCTDAIAAPGLKAYPSECRPEPTATPNGSTPTPTPTTTPGGGATCGNHMVEPTEFCDDGNTANCDDCPADCHAPPADCAGVEAVRHTQQVRIIGPTELGATQVCLSYPAGVVGLPGTGAVGGRLSGFAGSNNVVDFNNAAQVVLLPAGAQSEFTFTLSFDRCTGAPIPDVMAFSCITKDASDTFGNSIEPPTIVQCTPQAAP